MIRSVAITILIAIGPVTHVVAQDTVQRKISAAGYLSFTESAMHINFPGSDWYWESLIHNRLNFHYYPADHFSLSLQFRNRFLYGDRLKNDLFDYYRNSVSNDAGIIDLSWTATSGKSWMLNTAIDRLWIKYAWKDLEITAGRQRINWGLNYVWNTNDWFNNYSFFDVDYAERPGSDALRVQYFTGALSSAEAVVKIDSTNKLTWAGLFKTNIWQYDLQFLGGILAGEDAAIGFGWAGGLGSIGFRGEMSYIYPIRHRSATNGLFLLSVAFDYTFSNSLMIQAEGFYNQRPEGSEESLVDFYSRPSSVKDLSFTELNFFMQVSYPITPLLTGSMAVLFFPDVKGYYLGPSLTYSLGNNVELALIMQYFRGEFPYIQGVNLKQELIMVFGRMKWSF